MPPKGKAGKSGKKKTKENQENLRPTGKEGLLQSELDKKVKELAELKLRAQELETENEWLNDESKKIRLATDEYMHFMARKTNLRQNKVITLTDYHRKEIEDMNRDKDNLLKEYKDKKEAARLQLKQKEALLLRIKDELGKLKEYQEIQERQSEEIKRLQREIERMRAEHVKQIARMKLNNEEELQQQRNSENAKVEAIRRQADKEAEQFLYDQTLSIQDENIELKKRLQETLKRTKLLCGLKQRLEEEQLELINRIKLTNDLRKIRLDKVSPSMPEDPTKMIQHK